MFIGVKLKKLIITAAAMLIFCVCVGVFLFGRALQTENTFNNNDEEEVRLPILMYHSVCVNPRVAMSEYVISPEKFREDIKYLSEKGYTSVFVADVVNYVCGKGELPKKPIVISFDDGFYNSLSDALPILLEFNMKATVNIVGSYTQKYTDEPDANPEYAYLSWNDVKLLSDSGIIEIGNHSYNMHSNSYRNGCKIMPGETQEHYDRALREDLSQLQTALKENCGIEAKVFAYPFGALCKESLSIIKELGFTAALTCNEHINRLVKDSAILYSLGRINRASGYSTQEFMEKHGIN